MVRFLAYTMGSGVNMRSISFWKWSSAIWTRCGTSVPVVLSQVHIIDSAFGSVVNVRVWWASVCCQPTKHHPCLFEQGKDYLVCDLCGPSWVARYHAMSPMANPTTLRAVLRWLYDNQIAHTCGAGGDQVQLSMSYHVQKNKGVSGTGLVQAIKNGVIWPNSKGLTKWRSIHFTL